MRKPETISLYEFFQKIPIEEASRLYLEQKRWDKTNTAHIAAALAFLNAKNISLCLIAAKIVESIVAYGDKRGGEVEVDETFIE